MQSVRQDLGDHLLFDLPENTGADPEPFIASPPP
jgi:hypothetical protein